MTSPSNAISPLTASPTPIDVAALHALLRDAVEGGASVGFTLPLANTEVAAYWSGVFASVAAGMRVLLVARDDHAHIVGTVQLELAQKSNARHRCEVQNFSSSVPTAAAASALPLCRRPSTPPARSTAPSSTSTRAPPATRCTSMTIAATLAPE